MASREYFDVFSAPPRVLSTEIGGADVRLTHISEADISGERLLYAGPFEGFMLTYHLKPLVAKDVWADDKHARVPALSEGTLYFVDLSITRTARMPSRFDMVDVRLPMAAINALAEDLGATRVTSLRVPDQWSTRDPVIDHLNAAARQAMRKGEAGALLTSHLLHALVTHVATVYGGMKLKRTRPIGGLAPWQQKRATDLLAASLVKETSLPELAQACKLSASHFSRAFKNSTGLSPQAWLQQRRVEHAKELLRDEALSLGAIAQTCGFADQSHFTRVFGRITGVPPAHWRRHRR